MLKLLWPIMRLKTYIFVKPGIGETTRVLLRRIPWKILLREDVSKDDLDIQHIVQLAAEKNIPIERFPLQAI